MAAPRTAFEIGRLAERLAQSYYAHAAAIEVASDPRSDALVPDLLPGHAVPVGFVMRKDGTRHVFDSRHYLNEARTRPEVIGELPRTWLVGSLLTVGDALKDCGYFDHAPILELLYHLRNGVAHSNTFDFRNGGLKRLSRFPAHNRMAIVKGKKKTEYEILASLVGQKVLFDFMGPGDVLDVLLSVALHLMRNVAP
jgi:hypothetical protein